MKARTAIGLYGTTTGNEFLMLAKSLIQFRDNNANNFNIPHDFNLNFQTIEPRADDASDDDQMATSTSTIIHPGPRRGSCRNRLDGYNGPRDSSKREDLQSFDEIHFYFINFFRVSPTHHPQHIFIQCLINPPRDTS